MNQKSQKQKSSISLASACIKPHKHGSHFHLNNLNEPNRRKMCSYTQVKIQISWPGHHHFKHAIVCWNQLKKTFHKHIMAQQIMEIDHLPIFEEN